MKSHLAGVHSRSIYSGSVIGGFGGFRDRDAHAFNVTLYPLSYEAKTLVDLENVEISTSALQVRRSAN